MGKRLKRPEGEYHIAGNKLHESYHERDLDVDIMPDLSREHHVRRTVREANCISAKVKTALSSWTMRCLGKYARRTSASSWSMPQLRSRVELLEGVQENTTLMEPELFGMNYEKEGKPWICMFWKKEG